MKKIFTGKIENKKLKLDYQDEFLEKVKSLDGQEIQLTLDKRYHQRSNQENRYYWGVIINIFAAELGYTDDEMHNALKIKFLKTHEDKLLSIKSTRELSTQEFEDYCSKIRMFASCELGIYIPEPNEINF